jgi:hypothetical protein
MRRQCLPAGTRARGAACVSARACGPWTRAASRSGACQSGSLAVGLIDSWCQGCRLAPRSCRHAGVGRRHWGLGQNSELLPGWLAGYLRRCDCLQRRKPVRGGGARARPVVRHSTLSRWPLGRAVVQDAYAGHTVVRLP